MDKVDATMAAVNEQRELANEVAEAISNPMSGTMDIDEVSAATLINCLHELTTWWEGRLEGTAGGIGAGRIE